MNQITRQISNIPENLKGIELPRHTNLNLSELDLFKFHVSKAEALARHFFANLFKHIDTDGDGNLDFEEFVAYRTSGDKKATEDQR